MSCELYRDRLSEYIDLSLPANQHEAVDAHLQRCTICGVVYQDLLAIFRASREMPEIEPPERIWRKLEVALAAEAGHTNRETAGGPQGFSPGVIRAPHLFARPAFLLAATLLVAAGGFAVYQWNSVSNPAPGPVEVANTPAPNWPNGTNPHGGLQPINLVVMNKPYIEPEVVLNRIGQLEAEIQRQRPRWANDLKTVYEEDLNHVNRSVDQSLEFLKSHPGDEAAKEVYQAALLSKVEFLKLFAEL